MPYQYTPAGRAAADRGQAVHGRPHLPERGRVPRAVRGARPRRQPADPRQAQGGGPRAWAVEPVPAPPGARRARHEAVQPRLLADLRGAGQGRVLLRGAQLRRARHGQHGDPQHVRLRDRQAGLAGAAAGGRDPLGVLDDRAGRGLVGRHQHRSAHRARRRRVRPQRHQVVLVGRAAADVQGAHRDGQDRPERAAPPAAVDDRRAQGLTRHHASGGRRTCSASTTPAAIPEIHYERRAGAGRQPARRGGRRLRHLPGPARARAASTTACARSASPSGPSG